ncbi:MAG: IS3 family transposase [Oscillospiraceae bacterium]|nr:IS3 family transposase [Oscillospiraceae bacterium]
MPRSYRHISNYEKEILELKAQGLTRKEIGAKLGFTKEQVHNFISRYNKKQRKLKAGVSLKTKGRPPKDCEITEDMKINELKYIIVSCQISKDMTVKLVLDTIKKAMKKENVTAELKLHSDQGFQYTSQAYFNLTQSYGIMPSMSRRGNPYDNALAENFFSILKTECIHRIKLSGYDEARLIISEYINFYNNYRIQTNNKTTVL